MKEEKRLLDLLGEVDEKYITEAAPGKMKPKKLRWVKWAGLAACVCALVLGIIGKSLFTPPRPDIGPGEVYYDDLQLPHGSTDARIIYEAIKNYGSSSADIISFEESMVSRSPKILEGKITDIHIKNYSYEIVSYKFTPEGKNIKYETTTVVYEMRVDKVWYGENAVGDTVLIEDQIDFPDQKFSMKKGHSYVIPVRDAGNTINLYSQTAVSGDTTRDSAYSTMYPFHPQIEITQDGHYIVTTDWSTFAAAEGTKIVLNKDELSEMGNFYGEKLKLLSAETFDESMNKIISRYLTNQESKTEQ